MKKIKNILFVLYIKNKGVRRICLILGLLLAFLPAYLFVDSFYVNKEYPTLHSAVWIASEKQVRYIFEHYKYACDGCKASRDFNYWNKLVSNSSRVQNIVNTECEDTPEEEKEICKRVQNYLLQPVVVKFFDFNAFNLLKWAMILFYLPFLIACSIKWVVSGFKESNSGQKNATKNHKKK